MRLTLLEKKSVLRELIENNQDKGKQQGVYGHLSKKNKEELKQICLGLHIHLTGNETKPQMTRKIKEKIVIEQMSTTEVLADDTLAGFGKYRGKTYEWIWSNDQSYCLWATDTVVEEGGKCSPYLKRLAEYIENRRQQQFHATSEKATASSVSGTAPASGPVPLSTLLESQEDPEAQIEKLQQKMDELKSQLSTRRRNTTTKDTEMPGPEG